MDMAEDEVLKKRSPWLRAALWVLLTPIALFVLVMVLLYVPPVQDFIRRQAVSVAGDATGMQFAVERIDLRFPLDLVVRGVRVDDQETEGESLSRIPAQGNGALYISFFVLPLLALRGLRVYWQHRKQKKVKEGGSHEEN